MPAEPFAARFGRLVRRQRRSLDMTQSALATELGISQPSISSWEHGESVPTAQALLGLLRALQLDLTDVISLLDEPNGDEEAA